MVKVRDLMSRSPVTVDVRDSVGTAQARMHAAGIHHLPVIRNAELVGLLTHHDLMHACLRHVEVMRGGEECSFQRVVSVGEVMVRDVRTVGPDADAAEAARLLLELGVGCLPVVDGGQLLGMVTRTDFLAVALGALERREAPRRVEAGF